MGYTYIRQQLGHQGPVVQTFDQLTGFIVGTAIRDI